MPLRKSISHFLRDNRFARNVSLLVGGTATAQIISLLAAPALTRIYGTEAFGMLAVYVALISIISVFASLKYELAIPLPEDERQVVALTVLSLAVVAFITLITSIVVFYADQNIANILGIPEIAGYLWLVPLGVLLTGVFQVLNYWAIRLKDFSILAGIRIRQQLVMIGTQFALFNFGGAGLLLGQALGQGFGIRLLNKKLVPAGSWRLVSMRDVKFVAVRYRSFPLFSTWAGFLNTAGAHIPSLVFASFFGAASAGLYALAHRIVAMPMGLIGKAVAQVFFSDAAEENRAGRLAPLVISAQRSLIKVIVPPTLFLILFGPRAFSLLFGEQWRMGGEVASWLALWMLVSFSTSPLSTLFAVIEKQALGLIMQAVLFAVRFLGLAAGLYWQDFILAVMGFAIFNVIGYLLYQSVAFKAVGLSFSEGVRGYVLAAPLVLLALGIKDELTGVLQVGVCVLFMVVSVLYYYRLIKSFRNA